ncbi:hypothetical protein O1Q80_01120 [Lonepinella sp. MS14435]
MIIEKTLVDELSELIEHSQNSVVNYANYSLIRLFWQIGQRINSEILNQEAGCLWQTNCVDSIDTID